MIPRPSSYDSFCRLKEAAEKNGLRGTSEIAKALNETPQTITNWKARGVPANKIFKVARILNVSPEWLASGADEDSSQSSCFLDTFAQQAQFMEAVEREFAADLIKQYVLTDSPAIKNAIEAALSALYDQK